MVYIIIIYLAHLAVWTMSAVPWIMPSRYAYLYNVDTQRVFKYALVENTTCHFSYCYLLNIWVSTYVNIFKLIEKSANNVKFLTSLQHLYCQQLKSFNLYHCTCTANMQLESFNLYHSTCTANSLNHSTFITVLPTAWIIQPLSQHPYCQQLESFNLYHSTCTANSLNHSTFITAPILPTTWIIQPLSQHLYC